MKLETIVTHLGYDNKDSFGAMAVPIYQTTAYNFFTTKIAADRFALREVGQIYSRLTNPTTDVLEARVAAMEQGRAVIAVSSGQAAMFAAIANLAKSGENIIISKKLYGGTTSLCVHTLKRFGIETRLLTQTAQMTLRKRSMIRVERLFMKHYPILNLQLATQTK